MNRLLLDTNGYTSLLTGDKNVLNALAGAEQIFMSIFVIGELHAGFQANARYRENRKILQRFLSKPGVTILNATSKTSELFRSLIKQLKQNKLLLPINTVLVAAHAVETDALIVSYDGHFKKIPGIRLWDRDCFHYNIHF